MGTPASWPRKCLHSALARQSEENWFSNCLFVFGQMISGFDGKWFSSGVPANGLKPESEWTFNSEVILFLAREKAFKKKKKHSRKRSGWNEQFKGKIKTAQYILLSWLSAAPGNRWARSNTWLGFFFRRGKYTFQTYKLINFPSSLKNKTEKRWFPFCCRFGIY